MSLEDKEHKETTETEQKPKPTYKELTNAYKLLCKGAKADRVYPILGMTSAKQMYRALSESDLYKKYGTVMEQRRKRGVHPNRRRYSEARVNEVQKLVKDGMPTCQACAKLGIAVGTWHRWKRETKGLIKSKEELTGKTQDKYERSFRRYMADPTLTRAEVARIYGLDMEYMRKKWRKMGYNTADRERHTKPKVEIDDKRLKECWMMYTAGIASKKVAEYAGCGVTTLRAKFMKSEYPYAEYARKRFEKINGKGSYEKWPEKAGRKKNESNTVDRQCGQ